MVAAMAGPMSSWAGRLWAQQAEERWGGRGGPLDGSFSCNALRIVAIMRPAGAFMREPEEDPGLYLCALELRVHASAGPFSAPGELAAGEFGRQSWCFEPSASNMAAVDIRLFGKWSFEDVEVRTVPKLRGGWGAGGPSPAAPWHAAEAAAPPGGGRRQWGMARTHMDSSRQAAHPLRPSGWPRTHSVLQAAAQLKRQQRCQEWHFV